MLFVSITVLLSCFIQAYKKNTKIIFFFEKGTRNLSSKFINERELDLNWLNVSLHCIYRKIAFDFDKPTVFYKRTWLQEINVLLWHKHSLPKWKETTWTTPNMNCYGVEIVFMQPKNLFIYILVTTCDYSAYFSCCIMIGNICLLLNLSLYQRILPGSAYQTGTKLLRW